MHPAVAATPRQAHGIAGQAAQMMVPENLWDGSRAAGMDEPQLLLYRSNLLGSDLKVTNFGGGNTSAKLGAPDPLSGRSVPVMWIKGSGGDLGSMQLDGFATVHLDKVLALEAIYQGIEQQDAMAELLPHCAYNLNPRAASIETPAHAFLPHRHVDHTHPDAVIAVAAARDSQRLTREIFGGELGWVPWQRPGFDLALRMRTAAAAAPGLRGLILAGHGLFTWGESSKECYDTTIEMIGRAARYIASHGRPAPFGAAARTALPVAQRRQHAGRLMRRIRAAIGQPLRKVGHFNDAPEVLEFVDSQRLGELAALGTSCPDHFLRTKIRPLVVDFDADGPEGGSRLEAALADYRAAYRAYYERHRRADSPPIRDPNPVVFLLPSVGMLTFAADKATARIAGEYYLNAINVMRGASSIDQYVGLDAAEAFAIEYWSLEEAKLRRLPPPRQLAGRIAYVTGAASGIGRAVSEALLAEGANVLLTDINTEALQRTCDEFRARHGGDRVRQARVDVADEASVRASFEYLAQEYGGLDVLVASAGIATSAPIESTSLEQWQRSFDVLATGYFLVSRSAFEFMRPLGGSIVFVGSKNAVAASPNAAAYSSAKAAELHLARCLALEGGPHGIRVNSVNPDAVLRGSNIWDGQWRRERARAYGIDEAELESFYAQRSMLKLPVLPEDIARAVLFFACDVSAKSTGNVLNVDAGHAAAFLR
ncbi:MAG: bifunctional rhamnulose-1-phosphate aldolase/short-chain dehydrogenase [Gammaproteobacteria bacterium]|nr:bifunctional rhamnulose-1-phosphate aldolase/short-chain dehydrogenase [Gammaproteobacteria bacterium]